MKLFFSVLVLAFSCFYASASVSTIGDDVAGAWKYSVDTPDGVYQGKMIFTKTDEGYTGKLISQGGETNLRELKVEDNKVSFSLYVEGNLVKVKGTVEGDAFKGKVEVDYEYFTINATRVVEDLLVGTWKYSANTPEGVYTGKFVFSKSDNGYTGKMVSQGGETAMKDLKVEDNSVSFSVYTEGYFVKVKGKVDGEIFDGKAEVEYEYFPVKAEKVEE